MESSAFPFIVAVASSKPASHSTVGSNIGPGLPILLALLVIGTIAYFARRRRGGPNDRG
jgi:hypothetical protein